MPRIVVYSPAQPPREELAETPGRTVLHKCRDATGQRHRQRLPLGSVRGVFYLDALCLYCGEHLVWVEDEAEANATELGLTGKGH
jgi:hypothetical protein